VVLIVVGHYYLLFAAMGGSMSTVMVEGAVMSVFVAAAVAGFATTLWLVMAGLAAQGLLDVVHARLIANPGVPVWWPAFCMAFDVGAAAGLAWLLRRGRPARA
jgi:hypothetical protein